VKIVVAAVAVVAADIVAAEAEVVAVETVAIEADTADVDKKSFYKLKINEWQVKKLTCHFSCMSPVTPPFLDRSYIYSIEA
jgi:hypothetical protein